MDKFLITIGNIYIDHNIIGVNTGDGETLSAGEDYLAELGNEVLGGSAINVAMQLRRLGTKAGFIGKVGNDASGEVARRLLRDAGINDELLIASNTHTTSIAVNLVLKNGEHIGVHYGDASQKLTVDDIHFDSDILKTARAVYFGGTAKQPLLFSGVEVLFSKFYSLGIKIFYDPNRFPPSEGQINQKLLLAHLKYVEGYFPNEQELLRAIGTDDVDRALSEVLDSGVRFVALKQGSRGCRIMTKNQDITIQAKSVKPVSAVGAGDCFNATFISYYLKQFDLEACGAFATSAAAIKVGEGRWPERDDIERSTGN